MTQFTHILYECPEPGIALITLNRPDKHNAQDSRFLYELNAAFDLGARDPEVKVIVLGANGKNFSAGHDLSGSKDRESTHAQYPQVGTSSRALYDGKGVEARMAKEEEAYTGFSERWRNIPKVTIARVHGKCIAAGLMLAWPCDLILASDDAQFSDVTVALGTCGVEYLAHPWELGIRKAKQMLFTGDPISAADAWRLGMVNEVYPRDRLEEETMALARRIARQPLFALKTTKMAVNAAQDAQGRQNAMTTAFALHHLGHAQAQEVYGSPIIPAGIHGSIKRTPPSGGGKS